MNDPVVPGQVLLGRYQVERVLGQGGMGIVVAVRHLELGQLHAIKLLLPTVQAHDEWLERFTREAKVAACLTSEHVARVHDAGRMENGAPFMVMEYLDGSDLKALLSREGPLAVEEAVAYLMQVCEAIAEAHSKGIVHRDLKPANLFLVRRRNGSACIKVLDFGVSKQMDAQGLDLTSPAAILGSPLYMSPEQMAMSKSVDGRTDIWAMGAILYELLAGTSPFRGDSFYEVTTRVLQEEPTHLHVLRKDIPHALDEVITKCLRKRREERFQSVEELHAALVPFVSPVASMRPSALTESSSETIAATGTLTDDPATIALEKFETPAVAKKPKSLSSVVWSSMLVVGIGCGVGFGWLRHENATVHPSAAESSLAASPVLVLHRPSSVNENAQEDAQPNHSPNIVVPAVTILPLNSVQAVSAAPPRSVKPITVPKKIKKPRTVD